MTGARRAVDSPVSDVSHHPQRTQGGHPELRPVSGRAPVGEYLRQLWARRHFIMERAWSQAVTANRGFFLGNLWLVLNPLLDAGLYMVIFGLMFKPSIENFSTFLVIGIFMFSLSSRDVTGAAGSISANKGLMRAFMFPRAAIPLSTIMRNLIEAIPTMTVMVLLVTVMVGIPGPSALLVPLLFVLQVTLNVGLAFISARLGSMFPDAQKIIPLVFRVLLYGSGVMFSAARYEAVPWVGNIVHHNPFFQMLDMYRAMLMRHTVPPASEWMEFTLWAVCSLVLGFWFFWRGEVTYGRPE